MKGKNQLLVGFKGSFENITAVKAKDGDTILKGKIVQMTNPNTAGQQQQRNNFGITVDVGSLLLLFIRLYVKPTKATRSEFNEFVAHALDILPASVKWVKKKAYGHFDYTKGDLYPLNAVEEAGNPPIVNPTSVDVAVEWTYDAASQIQQGTDVIRYLIVNDTDPDYQEGTTGSTRDAEAATVTVPRPANGLNYLTVFAVDASTGEPTTSKALCSVANDGTVVWEANFDPIDQV